MTIESFRALPIEERIAALGELTPADKQALLYHWPFLQGKIRSPRNNGAAPGVICG
ncbi:hypothetical protein FACS189442_4670 [Spirochaetia bacterium]|nr:hypothetical protein FACS189442_4670 [Spirochaetia bacterium]